MFPLEHDGTGTGPYLTAQILGALFDAVSGALRELPSTKLSSLPRMADFALWVTASEKALGWQLTRWPPRRCSTNYCERLSERKLG